MKPFQLAEWTVHPGRNLIVSNEVVAPLYLDAVKSALPAGTTATHVIPDGEQHKTVENGN